MAAFEPIPHATDGIAAAVVDAAYKVHAALGPGLLESRYTKVSLPRTDAAKHAF